ncbi:unnamed protein product [Symbiodinium sp. CCMP2592]|nr:unnamed protein product [Symbiodinium sp. CCMP2592]
MASSSVPFSVGGLAELLVDDYAQVGASRGSFVEVLEIIPHGPTAGESSIKVALGMHGAVAYLQEDALRALPARPAAVPDPPLAKLTSRPPQVQQQPVPPQVRQQPVPEAQEPILYFLQEPARLICLRLVSSSELGQVAFNAVDAMLALVRQSRADVVQVDRYEDTCPVLEQLHSKGIWCSETYSSVASIQCPDGSMLSAVGLGSNKQNRARAVHLSVATALALELLKGSSPSLMASLRQVMHHFPVLESLVKEARQLKERADRPDPEVVLPPPPTLEECYDFARQFMVFHEDPDLWFSVGRIGGENL